jgi:rare lipoprotein A
LTLALALPPVAHADSMLGSSGAASAVADGRPAKNPRLDHSGHKRVGKASYYARRFAGRKMADGTPMRPESDNAASKTLPLGTVALVTNLANGKSAVVTVKDRGPFTKGRIIDVSPRTAKKLGFIEQGVVSVEVVPLTVPQPDGSVKSVLAWAEPEGEQRRR